MTTRYTAVHEIHFRVDGAPHFISPGELFVPVAADVQTLIDGGAIREPTETEVQVHQLTKSRAAKTAAADEIK